MVMDERSNNMATNTEEIKKKLEEVKREGEQALKSKAISEGRLSEMQSNLNKLLGNDTIEELSAKVQQLENEIQTKFNRLVQEYEI